MIRQYNFIVIVSLLYNQQGQLLALFAFQILSERKPKTTNNKSKYNLKIQLEKLEKSS